MFRSSVLIFIFILILITPSGAQSLQDKRRVEEEKRDDLKLSEYYLPDTEPIKPAAKQVAQGDFFKGLAKEKAVSLADLYRCLVTLKGAVQDAPDLESQYAYLAEAGILTPQLLNNPEYDRALRKGEAAYMFLKATGIKGGITLRLFGPRQRYAFKELVYQGIMFPGNVHDVMGGPELVITLTNAADYMAEQKTGLGQ